MPVREVLEYFKMSVMGNCDRTSKYHNSYKNANRKDQALEISIGMFQQDKKL